jgi:hypothetical protein
MSFDAYTAKMVLTIYTFPVLPSTPILVICLPLPPNFLRPHLHELHQRHRPRILLQTPARIAQNQLTEVYPCYASLDTFPSDLIRKPFVLCNTRVTFPVVTSLALSNPPY